ncbi:hypothetical protein EV182_001747, partial [Spiromyces aspiralis]
MATKTLYPIIDTDPKFSRVVRYFRLSDLAAATGIAAFGPGLMYWFEKYQPSGNGGAMLVKSMKHAGVLGVAAGFLFAYAQSSMRFWGWKENVREIQKYRAEYQRVTASGKQMEGESHLPDHMQVVAAQYSTNAVLNN